MKTNRKPNRLINEKSPYLLQHAYNPVNWYSWGEEAFDKAKREDKPIFLSIGYSTCHWCHVMAYESFEDAEVAAILNDNYISIKVDREERPDIDSIYIKVCQMMTGHGGWPLTIMMTPDKIPFYAGTYFPKESKHGIPGIMEALRQLSKKYKEDPDHIHEITKSVTAALQKTETTKSEERLTKETVDKAFRQLVNNFEPSYGGFGAAPKFPQPQNLFFLMKYYHFTGNTAALKMVETTLQSMAEGGVWDHIGYGFARYSTDEKWLVPHFEKMLYDNALLLMIYAECFQITGNPYYKQISEQIITFIEREMTSTEGAFYSAIDADSEGIEGKYYVWSYEEIFDILGEEIGELYTEIYGISPYGNFEGKNIPNLINSSLEIAAKEYDMSTELLKLELEKARQKLLAAREEREYPHVDDKILTAWNGLMIAALAKAGNAFQKKYTQTAEKAIAFIETNLVQNGRLQARYRDGEAKYPAYLDDYAFLLWSYIELYEATFSTGYLVKAKKLANQLVELFWDENNGGFYFTGKDSEALLSQDKEIFDGALPSGNGVVAVMFTRLAYLSGDDSYLDKSDEMFYTFYEDINQYPAASTFFMQALLLTENPTKEVVILGDKDDANRQSLLGKLNKFYLPNVSILAAEDPERFINAASFASEYSRLEGKTTVYVCENFSCQQPTTDMEKAFQMIIENNHFH